MMPWRRRVTLTMVVPPARISPRTILPVLSRPSQANTCSLTCVPPLRIRAGVVVAMSFLFVGAAEYFLETGHALLDFHEAGAAQRIDALGLGLGRDLHRIAVRQDQGLDR